MEEDKKRPTASHDHGYDAMPDRRGELRIRTVCRTARVKCATDIGLWRVQNISNKGMRLGTDIALTIGLTIEIALSEDTVFQARVIWSQGGYCGVAFDEAIDADATLTDRTRTRRVGKEGGSTGRSRWSQYH